MCTATSVCLAFLIMLLSAHVRAQAGPAAAGQHTNSQAPLTGGAPLRHGTLLLSSITLLDIPGATAASRSMQLTPAADADTTWRCCLSVKAYTAAVLHASSSYRTTQQAHASTAPSASFSTCRNSTSGSCAHALLADTATSESSLYKVALLLPAQAEQHNSPAPASAAARSAGSISAQQGMADDSGCGSGHDQLSDAGDPAETPPRPLSSAQPAATPAQHSSLHDVLLTVHAEQEVAGQIHLVVVTQLVHAGAGVVKVSLNMSHFSHTWTSPDALLAAPAAVDPPRFTNSTVSDPQQTPQSQPDAVLEQVPAANSTDIDGTDSTGAVPAWPPHCPTMPAQDAQEAVVTTPPAQAVPTTTAPAAAAPILPAFLPAELTTQLTNDPSVLAVYLQTMLGVMSPSDASPIQPQHQHASDLGVRGSVCAAGVTSDRSSRCGGCGALPDETDSAATAAWVLELQAVLLTCAWDPSLPSYLQAAAAAVRPPPMPTAASQLELFLTSVVSIPAVAALLDAVLASDVPVLSIATREQLLLGLMATAALLLLLSIRLCRSAGRAQRQNHSAQAQQQQQQDAHRAQANAAAATAQDACPHQQQDQHAVTLEEHMQDMDDDPFGYGPPPAALPAKTALDASQPGAPGSMLAAANAFRRASAMAAGEAAGALKDAFMRRHTYQLQQGSLAAAAGGYGSTSAGAGQFATAAAKPGAERDWLNEDDEDRVNQAPESIQRQLQAGGRWQRDAEGRLVRGSWKAVRNSLSAAAQAVLSAVGSGGKAVAAAGGFGRRSAAAGPAGAGGAAVAHTAGEGFEGGEAAEDALALQQLLSAAPGAVVSFSGK